VHSKSQPKNPGYCIPCTGSILEPLDEHFDAPDRKTPSKVEKLHQRPPERLRERSSAPARVVPGLMTSRSAELCGSPELLEPDSQPVSIRTILKPSWSVDQCSGDPLKAEFEKWTIMDFEQAIGNVDSEIGIDPDQTRFCDRKSKLDRRR
jgi:hypothetical protein